MTSLRQSPAPPDRALASRALRGASWGALAFLPFALLFVLVSRSSETLQRLDLRVADTMNGWARGSGAAVGFFEVLDWVLHPMVFRVAVLVACVLLWRRGARGPALWAGVTMAVGTLAGLLLKVLVQRARPTFDMPVAFADGYSFPSGHALNSMLGCVVLLGVALPLLPAARRWGAWAVGVVVVLLAGVDRLFLGVHYLSDVVGAWALALAVVVATAVGFGADVRPPARPRS